VRSEHPYRVAAAPRPDEVAPPSPDEGLGRRRSVHTLTQGAALGYLARGLAWAALALGLGASSSGVRGVVLCAPFAIFGLWAFAAPFFARKRPRVTLHERALVVPARRGRAAALSFEDVDEVWFELEPVPSCAVRAVRLVEHGGKKHRVALDGVDGADRVAAAIVRACSFPLVADARRALAAGRPLRFGGVRVDAEGIAVGRARLPWAELGRVYVDPAGLTLFRRGRGRGRRRFWRAITFDRVPHPTVLAALLSDRARGLVRTRAETSAIL